MVRTLELYWSGLATWLVRRLDRRWRRDDVDAAVRQAALRVGTELVSVRHGHGDDARVALEQLRFLLDVAERSRRLTQTEAARVRRAIHVVQELL